MIFEFVLYTFAIITVLAFYGSRKNLQPIAVTTQPEPEQQPQDEPIAQAPDLFVESAPLPEEVEPQDDPEIDDMPTAPLPEDEPIDDLLAITSSAQPLQLAECGAHQLRTLGVLEELKGARRWKKGEAIAQLTQLYSPQMVAA